MRSFFLSMLTVIMLAATQTTVHAQAAKYNYQSQQKLLPAELGTIYMGMNLKAFSQKIKIDTAEVNSMFEELRLEIPFEKGNIKSISVKFTGLTPEQKDALEKTDTVVEKGEFGNYEREVKRISVSKIMAAGKLYEVNVVYKERFDLAKYVVEKYGKPTDIYKKGDTYHIYDMQWTKVSADKLVWLIRYHEEVKVLKLASIMPGSEWDVGN